MFFILKEGEINLISLYKFLPFTPLEPQKNAMCDSFRLAVRHFLIYLQVISARFAIQYFFLPFLPFKLTSEKPHKSENFACIFFIPHSTYTHIQFHSIASLTLRSVRERSSSSYFILFDSMFIIFSHPHFSTLN